MKSIAFTKAFKGALCISGLLIVASLASIFFVNGLELGIDFTGGVQIVYILQEPATPGQIGSIRETLDRKGIPADIQTSQDMKEIFVKIKGLSDVENGLDQIREQRRNKRKITSAEEFTAFFKGLSPQVVASFAKEFAYLPGQEKPDLNGISLSEISRLVKTVYTNTLERQVFATLKSVFPVEKEGEKKFDINLINDADRVNEIISGVEARRAVAAIQKQLIAAKFKNIEELKSLPELQEVDFNLIQERFTAKIRFQSTDNRLNINTATQEEILPALDEIFKKANESSARQVINRKINSGGIYHKIEEINDIEGLRTMFRDDLTNLFYAGPLVLGSVETVGPSIGQLLKKQAVRIIFLSLLCIGLYIFWRFDLQFAFGAIVALIHDVIITIGVFSFTHREIDTTVIAALMALIGYSLNDTIVIYDRIRENRLAKKREPLDSIIDLSTNQNLSRTIITSLTTLFASAAIFVFGPIPTRDFSLAICIGVVVGTYSSIFVASPLVLYWGEKKGDKRKKKK